MTDQATELRNLVLRAMQQDAAGDGKSPCLLVVIGGKGGVGTTMMAVNLSVAMALNGSRVVLVDADRKQNDVATLCGLNDEDALVDLQTARRDIHEVLKLGPAGMQIVPGLGTANDEFDLSEMSQRRLIKQLRSLHRHADYVILDAGTGSGPVVRRFWRAADGIVLVTTTDSVAVMDCYATIKSHSSDETQTPIWLAVNQAQNPQQAQDVHQRIAESSRRFLGRQVHLLGWIPSDASVVAAAAAREPLVRHARESVVAEQIQSAANRLCMEIENASTVKREAA